MTLVQRTELAHAVIGCALEVHTQLGPGLLESAYGGCLAYEFRLAGLSSKSEVVIPVLYKGLCLDFGYRADFVVEGRILVEIKSVDKLAPIHSAQVMTYLNLARVEQALLFNFNERRLKDGIKSFLYRRRTDCSGAENRAVPEDLRIDQ